MYGTCFRSGTGIVGLAVMLLASRPEFHRFLPFFDVFFCFPICRAVQLRMAYSFREKQLNNASHT